MANLLWGANIFRDAVTQEHYSYATMDCATDAFMYGVSKSSMNDNPELRIALLNNLAVTQFLIGMKEYNQDVLLEARAWSLAAARESTLSSKVAKDNFYIIREWTTKLRQRWKHDR